MKNIILSNTDLVAIVDDEDYLELSKYKWNAHFPKKSSTSYARCSKGYMHRMILNAPKGLQVDHVDHNGLNNQKNNIRICSSKENNVNIKSQKNSTSKYLGVSFEKSRNKWKACIRFNGKQKTIGRYNTEDEAGLAYNKEAVIHHGDFANLNEIKKLTNDSEL